MNSCFQVPESHDILFSIADYLWDSSVLFVKMKLELINGVVLKITFWIPAVFYIG